MMATWLRDHLVAAGHMTERGITRRAKVRICRRCFADVLAGLDDDVCAFEVACDPTPLSAVGEAIAHLEGRRTLGLHRAGAGWYLDRRDSYDIAADPAGTKDREDVVRGHRCGTGLPTGALVAASGFAEVTPPLPAHSAPPF